MITNSSDYPLNMVRLLIELMFRTYNPDDQLQQS